jgi:hypothetical protein
MRYLLAVMVIVAGCELSPLQGVEDWAVGEVDSSAISGDGWMEIRINVGTTRHDYWLMVDDVMVSAGSAKMYPDTGIIVFTEAAEYGEGVLNGTYTWTIDDWSSTIVFSVNGEDASGSHEPMTGTLDHTQTREYGW